MSKRGSTISAVMPTLRRPKLLERSLRRVFEQTHPPDEIVVVIDGPDDATAEYLKTVDDPRLRIVQLEKNVGCPAARNAGVRSATCDWIAFLDDDDEWLADKLKLQLAAAQKSTLEWPIVSCRAIIRTGKVDLVRPRRFPRPGEPVCDYLFRRSLPIFGEGAILAPTIFTPREFLLRCPFPDDLRRLDDYYWLLRAGQQSGAGVIFPPTAEPLIIVHTEQERWHSPNNLIWPGTMTWVRSNRHLFTPQAYAGFLCAPISHRAAKLNQTGAFGEIWTEARRRGRPSWVDLTSHVMNFLFTRRTRDAVWRTIRRLRGL